MYMLDTQTGLGCACKNGLGCACTNKGLSAADDFGGATGMDWDYNSGTTPSMIPGLPDPPAWVIGLLSVWGVVSTIDILVDNHRFAKIKRRLDDADKPARRRRRTRKRN